MGELLLLTRGTTPSEASFRGQAHEVALTALRNFAAFGEERPIRSRYQFEARTREAVTWTVTLEFSHVGRVTDHSVTSMCGCLGYEMCERCERIKTEFWEYDFHCSIADAAHDWRHTFDALSARLIAERWEYFSSSAEDTYEWTEVLPS